MSITLELTETRISTNDSTDRKPKRINGWETKNAIVYDVSSQTLLKTERKAIEADHTCIKIPKRSLIPLQKDNVRISMPLNSTAGSDIIADLKLSSLGLKVKFERYRGHIDEIWVKGTPQYVP
ncbi:hypothetical protein DID88_001432 [Monilinia fructigena]|uniref:Uncharacterized protein n=1 Tax=Monilinia fructigena TaxID=38457 RepID=A0A395IXV2_9HELO|nr:hypothetical protein DID88_001432 [Monilinia fructigena]